MRILHTICAALVITVGGFCLAVSAFPEPSAVDQIMALERVDAARVAFVEAFNEWSSQHDKFTISVADKKRFGKVRKLWKEFDRLAKQVEY